MVKKCVVFLVVFAGFHLQAQTAVFNDLLQKHVTKDGLVDYQSFKKDLPKLIKFTDYVATTIPDDSWSVNKQKAFWINAYNAYTILLILQEYPLKSIIDVKIDGKTAWKTPLAKVGNQTYTLDFIEHEILRKKLFDPRIHVGVNCASISCPKLANIAFTEENIDTELTRLMNEFVNDTSKNNINKNNIKISAIFDWFKEDFMKTASLIEYLNNYSKIKINKNASINYLPYNWSLNEK